MECRARDLDASGRRLRDDSFLLLFNVHQEPLSFTIPQASFGERWRVVVDTSSERGDADGEVRASGRIQIPGRGLLLLVA